jgi:hypothetical protein
MIPVPGMTGNYVDVKCAVHVKLIEFQDLGDSYNLHLEVSKSLNIKDGCVYKKGDRFWFSQRKDADIRTLEECVIWDSI